MTQSQPPSLTSPSWSTRTKRIVLITLLVLVALAIWRLNEALPLLIISLVLAYLFNPITTFLERRVTRFLPGARNWAIILTLLGVISFFIIVILVVFPVLFNQLEEFGNRLPRLVAVIQENAEVWLSQPILINGQPITINGEPLIPLEQLLELNGGRELSLAEQIRALNLGELAQSFINSLTGPAVNVVGGALNFVISAIFLLTLVFYWLKDGSMFVERLTDFAPLTYRGDVKRLFYELARVWNAYLRGQLFLSSFVGVVVFSCATLLGVPNAPTLGLISGVMEFIPTLGPLIAIFPAILLALGSNSATIPGLGGVAFALVVIIVWITIQNVQAIFVSPRVMGSRLNLHPLVIIIGVIAGANLAGALGIILAAPTIASLRMLGQYFYGKLTDTNPFPSPALLPASPPLTLRQRVESFIEGARRLWQGIQTRIGSKPAVESRHSSGD